MRRLCFLLAVQGMVLAAAANAFGQHSGWYVGPSIGIVTGLGDSETDEYGNNLDQQVRGLSGPMAGVQLQYETGRLAFVLDGSYLRYGAESGVDAGPLRGRIQAEGVLLAAQVRYHFPVEPSGSFHAFIGLGPTAWVASNLRVQPWTASGQARTVRESVTTLGGKLSLGITYTVSRGRFYLDAAFLGTNLEGRAETPLGTFGLRRFGAFTASLGYLFRIGG